MARTARQRVASRRNLVKARLKRHRKAVIIGAATAGVVAGAYALDRKHNTMTVYHATTHSRARRIHKYGYQTRHRARAYSNYSGSGRMHESGRVFISTNKKGLKAYGPAITSSRIRKSKFKKYAKQDVHPKTLEGERFGFKSRHKSHFHIETKNMKKAGVKLRYKRDARKVAGKKIRSRWEQGPYREDW